MKKIIFIFAALFAITQVSQSQNMSNLHQVCTTVPVKSIHVSSTGKVFYATDGATDKRVVMYDPMTNIKMTADTGKGPYYCIEGTASNVYVGCSTHAIKFTSNGGFVNQISCTALGLTPANCGITAIGTNTSNAYLGSKFGKVLKTDFNLVKQANFLPTYSMGGNVTGLKFISDTMFIAMDPFDGSNYYGDFYYTINDDTVNFGTIPCLYDLNIKINDLAIWNNNIFQARNIFQSFARDGVCGPIAPSVSGYFLTMDQCGTKLWGGTSQGELVDFIGSSGNYSGSNIYNMNVSMYNNVDSIFDVAIDGLGELWIATNKGVYTTATTTITTGINSHDVETNVSVYPNPNNGQFVVNTPIDGTVKIYNVSGQIVAQETVYSGSNNVNIVNIPGCYFVTVETKNGSSAFKKMLVQ